jgi:hypothetical protein
VSLFRKRNCAANNTPVRLREDLCELSVEHRIWLFLFAVRVFVSCFSGFFLCSISLALVCVFVGVRGIGVNPNNWYQSFGSVAEHAGETHGPFERETDGGARIERLGSGQNTSVWDFEDTSGLISTRRVQRKSKGRERTPDAPSRAA